MSDQGFDAAVSRILTDRDFTRQVYENPEGALAQYDLGQGEWRAIGWTVQHDVQSELGDVAGLSANTINFAGLSLNFTRRLPEFKGQFDPTISQIAILRLF